MFTYLATQITHTQSTHMNTHGPCLHANGLFYSLIHLFSIPVSSQIALIPPFSHLGSFPNRVLIYPAQSQHVFPCLPYCVPQFHPLAGTPFSSKEDTED